jgi:hypothetical protein
LERVKVVQSTEVFNYFRIFELNQSFMLNKNKVLRTLENLPETFSIEEIIDQLVLIQKIEVGMEQAKNNETISTEEAKSRLNKWLK